MNTYSAILSILVINASDLLCLIRKTDADEVMGKRLWDGNNEVAYRPYFVLIETYFEPQTQEKPTPCGGVLIEPDTVLSAARCFHPYENLTKVIVKVGKFKLTRRGTYKSRRGRPKRIEAVSVEVYDQMISYEDDKDSKRPPPDIARLKLASAAVNREDVLHSCDPDFWFFENDKKLINKDLIAVGMGEINSDGDKPEVLQYLRITVTDEELKCGFETSFRFFDNIDRFCAVGAEELIETIYEYEEEEVERVYKHSGACYGDEGGPVIDDDYQKPCLVGVLNRGIEDGVDRLSPCRHGILFTSIENLENWVENKQFTEIFHKHKKSFWAPLKSLLGIRKKFGKRTTEGPKFQPSKVFEIKKPKQ